LLLDDLDFLLLDAVAEYKLSVDRLCAAGAASDLNRHIPPHTIEELTLAFMELFERGDALATIREPHWWRAPRKRSQPFVPTRDEIEAGLRGAFDLVYELTPQGGARWEEAVQVDWSLYLSTEYGDRFRSSEAQSRECLEYGIEVDRAYGRIKGNARWKELRPWRPVYWKEFPVGYRAQCRVSKPAVPSPGLGGVMDEYYGAPRWGLEYTQRYCHEPANLAPRKERIPAPAPECEMSSWPMEKLEQALDSEREQRRRFAVACAYAPRADIEALRNRAEYYSPEARFASVRELARRREATAVRPLTTLVLRKQYLPALWALGEIGDDRTLPVLEMLLVYGAGGGTLLGAIAQFGDRAIPMLEKALASREYTADFNAVAALGRIRSEASRASLERELAKAREEGRGWPCRRIEEALGRPTNWRTPEYLAAERLRHVRYVTGVERSAPNPADPVQALADTLTHSESARRRAAVDLLLEYEARDRLPQIARLAKDPEWEVRASVAHALLRLGGSRRLLGVLAKDPNPAVRWLARHPIIPDTE
jgi:hypothetical protein